MAPKNKAPTDKNQIEQYLLDRCQDADIKITQQRKSVIKTLAMLPDHPDVDTIYAAAIKIDPRLSLATIYRTLKILEDQNIVLRSDFGTERARYEIDFEAHHDHLIDIDTGTVIEFQNEEIEKMQVQAAKELGYELVDHRLVLYGRKLK